jgi:hypothetical protein
MPPTTSLQFPGLQHDERRTFISPNLRLEIVIYPLAPYNIPPFVTGRSADPIRMTVDPTDSHAGLVHFDWNKSIGQPSGQWSLTAKQKSDVGEVLAGRKVIDGDWADVTVIRNGLRIPLCRGIIDAVRESKSSSGGATVTNWFINGRDHGAFFEYPIVWQSIWAQTLGELTQGLFTTRVQGHIGGRPDELFAILIQAAFGSGRAAGQWAIPESLRERLQGERLVQALMVMTHAASKTAVTSGLRGGYYNEPQLWSTGGQTLHQTLQQWCNPLMNEMWVDLLPPEGLIPPNGTGSFVMPVQETVTSEYVSEGGGAVGASTPPPPADQSVTGGVTLAGAPHGTMAAIIRERPFMNTVEGANSMWFDLPSWTLPTWMIQTSDLGIGGHERYNVFELLADVGFGNTTEQAAQAKPVWNVEDIKAHGLRAYSQTTRYLAQATRDISQWLGTDRPTWQTLLQDWFGPSPYMRNGTVVAKTLLPEVRVGQKLWLDPGNTLEEEQFYVEGVNMTYTGPTQVSGAGGSTSFILTHGYKGTDEKLLDDIRVFASTFDRVGGYGEQPDTPFTIPEPTTTLHPPPL